MTLSRIYQPYALKQDSVIELDAKAYHHVARVLRAKKGDSFILFNGAGGEYTAIITQIDKKKAVLEIGNFIERNVESPLALTLAQGISRGEKMDYTIQKSVELGVKKIIPLMTERCNVRLDLERREKRLQHWQSIVIHACEQCGRNTVPVITDLIKMDDFLKEVKDDTKLILSPYATKKLSDCSIPGQSQVIIAVGPEGGFSEQEIEEAENSGFLGLNLGPRVLRTETAALAAITALQCKAGDF